MHTSHSLIEPARRCALPGTQIAPAFNDEIVLSLDPGPNCNKQDHKSGKHRRTHHHYRILMQIIEVNAKRVGRRNVINVSAHCLSQ